MSTAHHAKRLPKGPQPVARADLNTRAAFITRVYTHLLLAILAFAGIQAVLFETGIANIITRAISGERWLLAFAAFQLVAWLARRAAGRARALSSQYLALGAFVVAQAVIFVPLLRAAQNAAPGVLESAVLITGLGFAGLAAVAVITRKTSRFWGASSASASPWRWS